LYYLLFFHTLQKRLSWSPLGIVSSNNKSVIISGRVSEQGNPTGRGFTSQRTRVGEYVVNYSKPFSVAPGFVASVVAANQYTGAGRHAADTTINVLATENNAKVWTYEIDSNGRAVPVNEEFNFIVVGEFAQQQHVYAR
jgi:hypothetical protein